MDSSTHQGFEQQNQQPSSGLLRFRSAPSSLFSNFTGTLDSGVNLNKASFESEIGLSRFANSCGGNGEIQDKSRIAAADAAVPYSQQSFPGLPPHYPRQSSVSSSSAMDGSYDFLEGKSMSSNLLRQTSSPPGLFANLSGQNGYASMKGLGNYGGVNGSNGDISPSSNRLKSQLSFSSRHPSSLGMLSQISEIGTESIPNDDKLRRTSSGGDGRFFGSDNFLYSSWNDSSNFTENFSGMKREQENGDLGGRVQLLSHMSLPKIPSEVVAMDKFLHFQDSVPCKIRAKRGHATHPRSIAERVRRTRISERMRKLQELVPAMDKQTNTADMLDLAVEYIKDLQNQFETLRDMRAKCKCLNHQKPVSNQMV